MFGDYNIFSYIVNMDKEEKKAYERNWYQTIGKEKRDKANKNWTDKQVQLYRDYKKTLSCSKCGESHPACLDFHHKGNKEFNISNVIRRKSFKTIKKEIDKCIVLCANCHRKEHYK